jgi:hypothetical protein
VDFINVMVIPEGAGFSLFADQRTARDPNVVTDWRSRVGFRVPSRQLGRPPRGEPVVLEPHRSSQPRHRCQYKQ